MSLRDWGTHEGYEYHVKKMRGGLYRGYILDDYACHWRDAGDGSGKPGQAEIDVKNLINKYIEDGTLPYNKRGIEVNPEQD